MVGLIFLRQWGHESLWESHCFQHSKHAQCSHSFGLIGLSSTNMQTGQVQNCCAILASTNLSGGKFEDPSPMKDTHVGSEVYSSEQTCLATSNNTSCESKSDVFSLLTEPTGRPSDVRFLGRPLAGAECFSQNAQFSLWGCHEATVTLCEKALPSSLALIALCRVQ